MNERGMLSTNIIRTRIAEETYKEVAKELEKNIKNIVTGYLLRYRYDEEEDFKRLENVLCSIYSDIMQYDEKYPFEEDIFHIEQPLIKNIKKTVANYCTTEEKRKSISNFYKTTIHSFIKKGTLREMTRCIKKVGKEMEKMDNEHTKNSNSPSLTKEPSKSILMRDPSQKTFKERYLFSCCKPRNSNTMQK